MKHYVSLDVGGTKIYGGLVTGTGRILDTLEIPSHANQNASAVVSQMEAAVEQLLGRKKCAGIGVGLPGHVDHMQNRLVFSGPNMPVGLRRADIAGRLHERFGVRVEVENDAKIFALGEALYGAGKGYDRVVVVTIGTGIGGALISNGRVVHGKNNLVGEVGHMFTRGSKKRWEQLAAGGAFNRTGDLEKGAAAIAEGIANILNTLDPDCIIMGGGLSREPRLVSTVRTMARDLVFYPALKKTPIIKSTILRDAPLLGAMTIIHDETR